MIWQFQSMYDENLVNSSSVLFISGKTPMFNRVIADKVKTKCRGEQLDVDLSMFSDFLGGDTEEVEALSFEQYLLYCNTVKVNGLWFCSIDYKSLSSKEKENLRNHLKSPAKYGKLVVYVMDFRDKRELMKIRAIKTSTTVNMINTDWPRRETLLRLLDDEFRARGTIPSQKALNLFILRMGTYYEKYAEMIERIANGRETIDYSEMEAELRGVSSYVLSDLLWSLTKSYSSDSSKGLKSRKVYKVVNTLIAEQGALTMLRQLKKQVTDLGELRYYINIGIIPITVPYSMETVRSKIPKESSLQKMTDIVFRRNAVLASRTSLKDWLYMKMIILNALDSKTEIGALKGLTALINRNTYPNDRLMNCMGVKDTLEENLYELNRSLLREEEE